MKKLILVALMSFILSSIVLLGCIEQNNSNGIDTVFVTAPLNTLGLNLTDLPDNIYQFGEVYNDTERFDMFNENITKIEEYSVDYRYNNTKLPDSYYVLVELRKIESSEDAKIVFESQYDIFSEFITEELPLEGFGDQAIMAKVDTRYHLLLRKYNVILTITSAAEIDITDNDIINYATIIVNKIESRIQQ